MIFDLSKEPLLHIYVLFHENFVRKVRSLHFSVKYENFFENKIRLNTLQSQIHKKKLLFIDRLVVGSRVYPILGDFVSLCRCSSLWTRFIHCSCQVFIVFPSFHLYFAVFRSTHLVTAHRRHHVYSSLVHTLFVIPALICLILLTGKLDMLQWSDVDKSTMPFTVTFRIPCFSSKNDTFR